VERRCFFLTGSTVALFLLATLWSVTVTGFFEPASLAVSHLDAGAGNSFLIVRAALAAVASLSLLACFALASRLSTRITLVAAAFALVGVFVWSAVGIERYAPRFSEEAFQRLCVAQGQTPPLTSPEVARLLGPPLIAETLPSGALVWSYTYMPSGGFGWHKRIVRFGIDGRVTDVLRMDEP